MVRVFVFLVGVCLRRPGGVGEREREVGDPTVDMRPVVVAVSLLWTAICAYGGDTGTSAAVTINKRPVCGCKSYVCLQELCGQGTQVMKRLSTHLTRIRHDERGRTPALRHMHTPCAHTSVLPSIRALTCRTNQTRRPGAIRHCGSPVH